MPFAIESLGGGRVKVINKATRNVHSKSTTPAKAKAQIAIMNARERDGNRVRTTRQVAKSHPGVSSSHKSKHKKAKK